MIDAHIYSCITLRYTAPVECLFWRRDKMPYIGKRLLQVITDKRLNEHPIFFHVFSNGGAFLYQHVSLAMQKANTLFKVEYVMRYEKIVFLFFHNKRIQNDTLILSDFKRHIFSRDRCELFFNE